MDHQQLDLVRRSLAARNPSALAIAADLFHRRLFYLAPALEACFDPDARARDTAFLAFLRGVVADLDRLDHVLPRLVELARAADRAGVTPADYEAVRAALLFALRTALYDAFSFQVRAAWSSTFDLLAGVMRRAVDHPGAAAADAASSAQRDRTPRVAARSGTHRLAPAGDDDGAEENTPPSARAAG
jgi:hemoglobin-like flavoprotein